MRDWQAAKGRDGGSSSGTHPHPLADAARQQHQADAAIGNRSSVLLQARHQGNGEVCSGAGSEVAREWRQWRAAASGSSLSRPNAPARQPGTLWSPCGPLLAAGRPAEAAAAPPQPGACTLLVGGLQGGPLRELAPLPAWCSHR